MPGLARRPSSRQLSAITAITWSPSIRWPFSSTMIIRSASPSSAMPTSARISRTLRDQRLGRGRADLEIDVEPVRLDADRDHLGAELPQRLGRDLVGGAIGAVDDDPQALERDLAAERPLGVLDVARLDVVDALGAAEVRRTGEHRRDVAVHQRLDPRLDLVGELVAVGPEELDAVVLVGVVRGGDHHAEIAAHRAGQHRDRRRRHRARAAARPCRPT